ncbi:YSC84-related protein [Paraferrimonas sp. SM1919]|uniref:YSC84-related protein n=1 Tax=Paraferrimonas sp. SM1919 TaxID=2662263 RepID=UPI0013D71F4A|nr:YSC84-related protein [Paraferrimonas sp. SM1919]
MRILLVLVATLISLVSRADEAETIATFKQATVTASYFSSAYGYAIFPTVGKGGFGLGGAYGEGTVYQAGKPLGKTSLTQITFGFQLGGQAYSEIIFFKNKAAFDEFVSGSFEFGAQASAVAITIGANAHAGSMGNSASAGKTNATGHYVNGMAVFTIAKGGLMYEASIGGQTFSYEGF